MLTTRYFSVCMKHKCWKQLLNLEAKYTNCSHVFVCLFRLMLDLEKRNGFTYKFRNNDVSLKRKTHVLTYFLLQWFFNVSKHDWHSLWPQADNWTGFRNGKSHSTHTSSSGMSLTKS